MHLEGFASELFVYFLYIWTIRMFCIETFSILTNPDNTQKYHYRYCNVWILLLFVFVFYNDDSDYIHIIATILI